VLFFATAGSGHLYTLSMTRAHEHMLIRLVLGGDEAAATELIRAHQGALFGFLVRLSSRRDLAEDVMQEAFVKALQHLHRFDFEHRFSTWLFTIARRVYWNVMEKHTPKAVGDALEGLHESQLAKESSWGQAAPQVAEGLELQEERTRSAMVLQAALLELPPVQREIVILFHQQGWPIALLASTLGMPEGTIKSHLHRARVRLRELVTLADGDRVVPHRPSQLSNAHSGDTHAEGAQAGSTEPEQMPSAPSRTQQSQAHSSNNRGRST
jgi:RNA polymerase sigma-70 factor (ECF subfamily)